MNTDKKHLILTIGLPGSGKTTWAKEQIAADPTGNTVRVNRDDLRFEIFGKYVLDGRGQEQHITQVQTERVTKALREGKTVIIDDTNLVARFRQSWETLAQTEGAKFSLKVLAVDVETCVERVQERWERDGERQVPRHVIERMAERFLAENSR